MNKPCPLKVKYYDLVPRTLPVYLYYIIYEINDNTFSKLKNTCLTGKAGEGFRNLEGVG